MSVDAVRGDVKVAIIGGSGLADLDAVVWQQELQPETQWGKSSAPVKVGLLDGCPVYFLPRHGADHSLAPHLINYRANMAALKSVGITHVLAVNAVGGLADTMGPQALVIPDQIIDYSHGRETTFFDGVQQSLQHIDFTQPYSTTLRTLLLEAAQRESLACIDGAVYGCTQGPRLETAAEVRRCRADGCDLLGMTGMPEAALARELDIEYASVCLVVNWGAGMTSEPITMVDIERVIDAGMVEVKTLLAATLKWLVSISE